MNVSEMAMHMARLTNPRRMLARRAPACAGAGR